MLRGAATFIVEEGSFSAGFSHGGVHTLGLTILFSAVHDAASSYPIYIEQLQDLLLQYGFLTGDPDALPAFAQRLSIDRQLGDDLLSMLRAVRLAEPAVSYLELLGLVLVALCGEQEAHALSGEARAELEARKVFNFLLEHKRVLQGNAPEPFEHYEEVEDLAAFSESEEPTAAERISAITLPAFVSPANRPAAAFARPLALSAEDEDLGKVDEGRSRPAPSVLPPVTRVPVADWPSAAAPTPERRAMLLPTVGILGALVGIGIGMFLAHPPTVPAPSSAPAAGAPAAETSVQGPAPLSPFRQPASQRSLHGRGLTALGKTWQANARQPMVSDHAAQSSLPPPAAASSLRARSSRSELLSAATRQRGSAESPTPLVAGVREMAPAGPDPADSGLRLHSSRVLVGSAGIMAANLVSSPAPVYPAQASAAQVQGEVVVEAIVGRDGEVIDSRVVSGPPLLREAALDAVRRWRYRPYEVDGAPAEIATTARLDFRLDAD